MSRGFESYEERRALYERLRKRDGAHVLVEGNKPGTYASIQHKGSNLCVDLYCKCGTSGHLDADFLYCVQCKDCGQRYFLGEVLNLIPLTEEEAKVYWSNRIPTFQDSDPEPEAP